jgi:hypothetical protein
MRILTELEDRLHRDLGTPEEWACIAHSLGLTDLQPEQRDALYSRLEPFSGSTSTLTNLPSYGGLIMRAHWTG